MPKCKKCSYKSKYRNFVCPKCNYVNEPDVEEVKIRSAKDVLKIMGEKS